MSLSRSAFNCESFREGDFAYSTNGAAFDVAQRKLAATVTDLWHTKMLLRLQEKRLPEPTN